MFKVIVYFVTVKLIYNLGGIMCGTLEIWIEYSLNFYKVFVMSKECTWIYYSFNFQLVHVEFFQSQIIPPYSLVLCT